MTTGKLVVYYGWRIGYKSARGDASTSALSFKRPEIVDEGDSVRVFVDFNADSLNSSVKGGKHFERFGKVALPGRDFLAGRW